MRLFLAISLPANLRHEVTKNTKALQGVIHGKWVEEENLHLTLAFIGEVPEGELPVVIKNLEDVTEKFRPFELLINGIIPIPTSKPRILALSVKAPVEVCGLQKSLTSVLRGHGIVPSAYELHLTLVRLREPIKTIPKTKPLSARFKVGEITLFQSTLTQKGPIYRPLKALKLSSGALSGRLRSVVAICVINPKNEVLLIWHKEHYRNAWQFPQGGIEPGAGLEETARRELKEEVGISSGRLLSLQENVYKYRWPAKLIKQGTDINKKSFTGQVVSLAVMRVDTVRPKLTPDPREAAKVKWIPLNQLLANLGPVRRGIGKIAMVELKRLGLEPRT